MFANRAINLIFIYEFVQYGFGFLAAIKFFLTRTTVFAKAVVGVAELFEFAEDILRDLVVGKAYTFARLAFATAGAVATRFGMVFLFEKIEFHVCLFLL